MRDLKKDIADYMQTKIENYTLTKTGSIKFTIKDIGYSVYYNPTTEILHFNLLRKDMKIIKRSEAMKILWNNPGSSKEKYCAGKYEWSGSQADYIGKTEHVSYDVMALYVVSNRDENGAYATIMCIS